MKVSLEHKVRTIDKDDDSAWVGVETAERKVKLDITYISGCDDDHPTFSI